MIDLEKLEQSIDELCESMDKMSKEELIEDN